MNFKDRLAFLLKARYPIILIASTEEERVEFIIRKIAQDQVVRNYYCWDFLTGYKEILGKTGLGTRNPLQALEVIDRLPPELGAIFILKDFSSFFKDPIIIRQVKNLNVRLNTQSKNVIFISTDPSIPSSLENFITVVDFPLPTYEEIHNEIRRLRKSLGQNASYQIEETLAHACRGLTFERLRRLFSRIATTSGKLDLQIIPLIIQEKKHSIQQSRILEVCNTNKKLSDLGGLPNFKRWVNTRKQAFSTQSRYYGLSYPKGVLLVGIQGTGKSLGAKILAYEWNLPLLRLDFGKLFGSLVGQSEYRLRMVLQLAESTSPCILWIDEIDKAFSTESNDGDAGTTRRILSTFLSWLSEKKFPVFIVATANSIKSIPTELVRRGRFDDIFFLDLPDIYERKEILTVYSKRTRSAKQSVVLLDLVSMITNDFAGAELEHMLVEARRLGFSENRDFELRDILECSQSLIPLAKIKGAEIANLRKESYFSGISLA
jgi:AAA+ superfamily predicted ATPase